MAPDPPKKFCHYCGQPLTYKHIEGRIRPYCSSCRQPIYENPVPATCLIVIDAKDRLLLVKRNIEPKLGWWCLPGGYVELGEEPEEGALRELTEETGIIARSQRLLGVIKATSRIYDTLMMVGYLVTDYSGNLRAGDDAEEVAFFDLDRLPDIAFRSHRHFLQVYLTTLDDGQSA